MVKLCLGCYEVYDDFKFDVVNNWEFCPKSNCVGEVIEVDELILPTIIELNKKGYYTKNCCSGHYYKNGGNHCYIMFEKDFFELSCLPNEFVREGSLGYFTIRRKLEGSGHDLFKEINQCANELLEWAISLPSLV